MPTSLEGLLSSLSLESYADTLLEEELSLSTLKWMAADADSQFVESMEELGMPADDAARLMAALASSGGNQGDERAETVESSSSSAAASGSSTSAHAEPAATANSQPDSSLPDEDLLDIVGRRVLITGLISRKELQWAMRHRDRT